MATDFVKRYFKKINTRVAAVNKQDSFSMSFLNSINNGDNKLFQKHMMETRIFDGSWVDFIEENLKFLDTVVRNPKTFIKNMDEIVPIERAKKTTSESVRHLASHSHMVREVTKSGEVIPKKILTIMREEEYGIYENRFIKTLVDKLVSFVERRYDTIRSLIGTDYINKFFSSSNFDYEGVKVEYELNLVVTKRINDNDAEKKNFELLNRVEILRTFIIGFLKTELMKELKSAKPVYSPIQKTNILTKDPNYKKCYELWLFLDSYGKLEYTIQTSMADSLFREEYVENIREMTLYSFATVISNDESNMGKFELVPDIIRKKKFPKILSNLEEHERKNEIEMERQLINEFYYQEARKIYSRRIQDRMNDGEPFHVALKDIYQGAFKITEQIFQDLMKVPEDIKDDPMALLRFRMRNQKAIEAIYKFKMQDLKKMDRERLKNEKQIEREKIRIEAMRGKKIAAQAEETTIEKLEQEKAYLIKAVEVESIKTMAAKDKEIKALIRQREREKVKIQQHIEKEVAKITNQKNRAIERILKKEMLEKEKEEKRIQREKNLEAKRLQKAKELALKQEKEAKEKEKERIAQEKEKARLAIQKAKDQEKAKKAKELKDQKAKAAKEKEKIRLAAQKAKEKEQEKARKAKEVEAQKAKAAKEKEKQRLAEQMAKEKEKLKKAKETETAKAKEAKEKEKLHIASQLLEDQSSETPVKKRSTKKPVSKDNSPVNDTPQNGSETT